MRKIGKKYTPKEEKAMDEKFIADMHELYTNYTDVRDNPYADEYNTERVEDYLKYKLSYN